MKDAVTVFCCQALGTPRRDKLGIESVKRAKSAPRGVAFLEVIVLFSDPYAKDEILSRGPMLAEYRDAKNKPTAGIRLDIPAYLMGSFKVLESFGFALKRRHGQNFRKHIKFDEFDSSLYIQVGVKKEDEEMQWTDYSAAEAREGLKKLNAKKGPRFDYMMSPPPGNAPAAPRSRQRESRSSTKSSSAFPWIPPTRQQAGGQNGLRTGDDSNAME